MEPKQVEEFKVWLKDYISDFYGDDEFINANIKLKEDHSYRVCEEMDYLTASLGLDDNMRRIAYVSALFHDLGRFGQFVKWRTYADSRSESHAELALDVISETGILARIDSRESSLIIKAIKYHGIKQLSDGLDDDELLFCKLLRDADKLDIYYVVIKYYGEYEKDPDGFKLELELPDIGGYTDEVIDEILAGRRVDYIKLRSWNDMKLLQLGWVYDVNFNAAMQRIKDRRYLEKILHYMPEDKRLEKVKDKLFKYVNRRLENER